MFVNPMQSATNFIKKLQMKIQLTIKVIIVMLALIFSFGCNFNKQKPSASSTPLNKLHYEPELRLTLKTNRDYSDKSIVTVAFSPDGKRIASGNSEGTICIWDISSRKRLKTIKGHSTFVSFITFSQDSKIITSVSSDQTIEQWNVLTGKLLSSKKETRDTRSFVAQSPDGKYTATGQGDPNREETDNTINLRDNVTGKCIRTLTGHSLSVSALAFSPDSRFLASGSWDQTILLWNISTGKKIKMFKGYADLTAITFSPNGKLIASGQGEIIRVWNLESEKNSFYMKSFKDNSWVVVTSENRFDSSNRKTTSHLYWEYFNEDRETQIIPLSQFSKYFYTPGLVSKVYNHKKLRPVPTLKQILTYPEGKVLKVVKSKS